MRKSSIIIVIAVVVVGYLLFRGDNADFGLKTTQVQKQEAQDVDNTKTFESEQWKFKVDVPNVEMIASASGGLTTYEFGPNSITILPENMESLLTSGIGNPETSDAELGSAPATKISGSNEQNGVDFTLYYVKHNGNVISFQGTADFLETVQESFKTF